MNAIATTTLNVPTVNVPSTNQVQLNPYDYMNKGINDIVLDYLSLLNPERKKSINTIFMGIGILLTADMIKTVSQSLIKENQTSINSFIISSFKLVSFKNIFSVVNYGINSSYFFCYYMKSKFVNMFNKKIIDICKIKEFATSIEINTSQIFLNNLIKFIESNKNITNLSDVRSIKFDEIFQNKLIINQSNISHIKELHNICIDYDDIKININKLTYKYTNNELNTINAIQNEASLFDILLLKCENPEMFKLYDHFSKMNFKIEYKAGLHYSQIMSYQNYNNQIAITTNSCNFFTSICKLLYDDLKKTSSQNIHIIMTNIYIFSVSYCQSLDRNGFYFRFKEKYFSSKTSSCHVTNSNPGSTNITNYLITMYAEVESLAVKLFKDWNSIFIPKIELLLTEKTTNTSSNDNSTTLLVELISEKEIEKSVLYKKLNKFIEIINNMSKKHNTNKKININTINICENIVIEEKENPLYTSYYNQKKQLIDEKKTTDEIIKLLGPEPIKTILDEKIEKKIKVNLINTKYCAFNNLYLRKQQDILLFELVERFREDKKLMEELGIPNKLGILFYGDPGCGKTTGIITIGSYFGRDIFYVNLKSIKTNNDLKMIFDHINNSHSGGGIIVLEDIDAMTSIVEKRTNKYLSNDNKTNLVDSSDDSITLEYLLNLLDGTLTYDDSIVIITTNHLEYLDPALYRPGRIDNLIEMKKCDHYQISKIFNKFICREIDPNVLNKIPEDTYTPAKIIFSLMNWIKKRNEPDDIIMKEFMILKN